MTISSTANKATSYGNGVATNWPYKFLIPNQSQLSVIVTDPLGNQTQLSASQYAVTGIGDPNGGTITYPLSGAPLPALWSITRLRTLPIVQQTDIVNQDGFYPDVIESALDYLTMVDQQLCEQLGRTLSFPAADPALSGVLPAAAARANKGFGFDASGLPFMIDLTIGSVLAPVVHSIAMLRLVSQLVATDVFVTDYGYGRGGGGAYSKAYAVAPTGWDNGGSQIVAADGAGWQLNATRVTPCQFGAYRDGIAGEIAGHDDTQSVQNWLNALSPTLIGDWEAGVYNTSATLTKTASNITIKTAGAANTVVNWIGAAGSTDLMTLGDGSTTCSFWEVGGIGFESAVKMTGGAAFHVRKFMTRNYFEGAACGMITENGNLYHGAWLDLINVFYFPNIDATKCQGDGCRWNGSATDNSGSDLFFTRGNISYCGGVGMRQGGGFGGVRTGQVNSFVNFRNYSVDTTIVARGNREVFIQSVCDGAQETGIVIDDALTSNSPISISGFVASTGQINAAPGAPHHGIWIKNWANGRIAIDATEVFNHLGNAIQKDDQTCILTISPSTHLFNNGGYAVSALNPDQNIWYFGGYAGNNAAGNWNANAELANGDTFTPVVSSQSGALTAYSATMRWSKVGKIVTFTSFITITTNGTGAGSINITLPFTTHLAVAVMGKEIGVSGKSLAGYISSNSSIEGVTFFDNSYPGANGAILVLSGTCEVQ